MSSMHILLPTPDYPPMPGGIQLLLERLVRHSRLSYEVVTLSAPDGSEVLTVPGVTRTPRLGGHRSDIGVLNMLAFGRAITRRPDAVLSGHIVTSPAALAAQGLLGVPVIQYLYGDELRDHSGLSRFAVQRARASVVISSHTRRLALALGASTDSVHLILPGVDPPAGPQPLPSQSRARDRPPTVITVARLEDRYKGFDVTIRALPLIRARVPDARWVVVGDGSLRDELQAMASSHGVADCVTFAGPLDDGARDAWLDRADVFVMPSRLMPGGLGGGEGFGIVYLEAGAHGLPCVAGNVGGSVDAVIDGETGLLVDPTDHVAVADAIADLLLDSDLRLRLGEAGRTRAEWLSWARMAEEVDTLIEQVVTAAKR
jgi:phosphatidylinositol alpha-1,6-mannosyltransferase